MDFPSPRFLRNSEKRKSFSVREIPLGVKLVSVLLFIFSGLMFFASVLLLFLRNNLNIASSLGVPIESISDFSQVVVVFAIIFIFLSFIPFFTAIYLRKGKSFARNISLIIGFFIVYQSIVSFDFSSWNKWLDLIIGLFILGILYFDKKSKNYFHKVK